MFHASRFKFQGLAFLEFFIKVVEGKNIIFEKIKKTIMEYLKEVAVEKIKFSNYKKLTPQIYKKAFLLGKALKNKKIIHINSTALGGGVAEMLRSQIPLEKSLGLNSKWFVLKGNQRFFQTTKEIHNFLQGKKNHLKEEDKNYYLNWLFKKIAPDFKKLLEEENPDIVLIHDPQPLPLIKFIPKNIKTILRIHIDLSTPSPAILNFLKKYILLYQKTIFSHKDYIPKWFPKNRAEIIYPAIDPFIEKNKPLRLSYAKEVIFSFGINPEKPLITQISRFDPWKNPLGVIQMYYLVKNKHPEIQLALVGFMQAKDDPEAIKVFKKVKKHAKGDKDIFLFYDLKQIKALSNDLFVNAAVKASDVIIQNSIREGFGLTVTEAMWKRKPVVGGDAKGIKIQIKHKKNGFIVKNPKEGAKYISLLLENKKLAREIGKNAHQTVKEKFLISRLILDHLRMYSEVNLKAQSAKRKAKA